MCAFYTSLCSSKLKVTPPHIAQYLRDVLLPILTDTQREFLDAPLQLEELPLESFSIKKYITRTIWPTHQIV